jgi:integral membrane protein
MLPAGILRFDTPPARLRATAFLEGLSYVVLLFVAMPLKYLADQPLAVRVVGSVHGALFVALALLILRALYTRERQFPWAVRLGVASLLPFGTFFFERDLREADERHRARCARDGS